MTLNFDTFPIQFLNGISYASLIFLISAGFTITFGVVRVLNFAYGATFMLGAFAAWEIQQRGWGFLLAVLGSTAVCFGFNAVFERTLVSKMYGRSYLDQVLLTIGMGLVLGDVVLRVWGGDPRRILPPEFLNGRTEIFGNIYPIYRLALVFFGAAVALAIYVVLQRTVFGVRLRAAVEDPEMAAAVGVNTRRLFTLVFAGSGALAGLGAGLGGPVLGASIGMDQSLLIDALIVVVIGGPGSVLGALVGAIFLGLTNTFGNVLVPDYANFAVFGLMIVVLLFRPAGLFGQRQVERL